MINGVGWGIEVSGMMPDIVGDAVAFYVARLVDAYMQIEDTEVLPARALADWDFYQDEGVTG